MSIKLLLHHPYKPDDFWRHYVISKQNIFHTNGAISKILWWLTVQLQMAKNTESTVCEWTAQPTWSLAPPAVDGFGRITGGCTTFSLMTWSMAVAGRRGITTLVVATHSQQHHHQSWPCFTLSTSAPTSSHHSTSSCHSSDTSGTQVRTNHLAAWHELQVNHQKANFKWDFYVLKTRS